METDDEKQPASDDEMLELLEEFMQADEEESLRMLESQGAQLLSDTALQSVRDRIAELSDMIATLEEKLVLLEQTKQRQDKATAPEPPPAFPLDMMKKLLAGMPDYHIPIPDQETVLDAIASFPPDTLLAFMLQMASPQQQALAAQLFQKAGYTELERSEMLAGFERAASLRQGTNRELLELLLHELWQHPLEERKRFFRGEVQILNIEKLQKYIEEHHIDMADLNEEIQQKQDMPAPSPVAQSDAVEKETDPERPWSLAEWEEDLARESAQPAASERKEEQPAAATPEEQRAQIRALLVELQKMKERDGSLPFELPPDIFEKFDQSTEPIPRKIYIFSRVMLLLLHSEGGKYWPDLQEAKALLHELMDDPATMAEPGPDKTLVELFQQALQLITLAEGDKNTKEMLATIEAASDIIANTSGEQNPFVRLTALMNRCVAYLESPSYDQEENFTRAIQDCDAHIALAASLQQPIMEAYGYMLRGAARTYYYQTAQNRAESKKALHDIEQALRFFTQEAYPDEWAELHLLRSSVYQSYHYGDVWQHYENALQDALLALAHLPQAEKPMRRAAAHKCCGDAYAARLSRNPLDDARKAREHYQQALQVFTPQSAPREWASTRISLAVVERTLQDLPFRSNERETKPSFFDLEIPATEIITHLYKGYERIIADLTEVIEVATREHDSYNRAEAYYERAFTRAAIAQGERRQLLQAVLEDFEHALEVFTPERYPVKWAAIQYNIARSAPRFTVIGKEQGAEMALRAIDAALTVYTADEMPFDYRRAHKMRAQICESLQRLPEAWQSLLEARRVERLLLTTTQSGKRLYDLLASFTQAETSLHLAHIASRLDPPNYAEAARALEEGRARSLHHTQMSPEQAQNLPDIPSLEDMARCLTHPQAALVYLAAGVNISASADLDRQLALGVDAGFALVLSREDSGTPQVDFLALPRLTGLALTLLQEPAPIDDEQMADPLSVPGEQIDEVARGPQDRRYALPIKLEYALSQLGDMGLNDLAQYLQSKGMREITLIAYSSLGLFPLNAAPITLVDGSTHYLGELFEVSFAPSAYAAARARQRAEKAGTITSVLAAGNPQPQLAGLAILPYAAGEAQLVSELATAGAYETHYLPSEQITREALLRALCQPTGASLYAHLAIHAVYQPREPRHSQVLLAGTGQMPERERSIFASELLDGAINLTGVRLLVLSACQSSLIDSGQVPNEVVGLAAAFLQAGAAGVIASLWKVADMATYLLMTRFARLYLEGHGQVSPAWALAQAQRWLREEATYRAIVEYNPLDLPPHHPLARQWGLEEFQQQAGRTPDALPFARPEYWAAFTLNGY